jgi:hypothetical protein
MAVVSGSIQMGADQSVHFVGFKETILLNPV